MVEASRSKIFARGIGKDSALGFKLIDQEGIQSGLTGRDEGVGTGSRIDSENALEGEGAFGRGKSDSGETGDGVCGGSQIGDDGILRCRGAKNIGIGEQRDGILRVLAKALEIGKEKCFVFVNGEANGAAELLASESVFDRVARPG